MPVETQNTQRLEHLVGANAAVADLLQLAILEVSQEDALKKKEAVKALVRQAMALRDSMNQAERTFNSEKQKFDKQLGKLLSKLNQTASGQAPEAGEPDGDASEQAT